MSINIALIDAANNCAARGAKATLTLRSGVQFTGRLRKDNLLDTVVIYPEGETGWTTVRVGEIAAVGSHR